jgi:hypothetical protein
VGPTAPHAHVHTSAAMRTRTVTTTVSVGLVGGIEVGTAWVCEIHQRRTVERERVVERGAEGRGGCWASMWMRSAAACVA